MHTYSIIMLSNLLSLYHSDCMDMDIEMGNSKIGSGSKMQKLVSMSSLLFSCMALAGMLVLLVQNQQMQASLSQFARQDNPWAPDASQQERALREVRT